MSKYIPPLPYWTGPGHDHGYLDVAITFSNAKYLPAPWDYPEDRIVVGPEGRQQPFNKVVISEHHQIWQDGYPIHFRKTSDGYIAYLDNPVDEDDEILMVRTVVTTDAS